MQTKRRESGRMKEIQRLINNKAVEVTVAVNGKTVEKVSIEVPEKRFNQSKLRRVIISSLDILKWNTKFHFKNRHYKEQNKIEEEIINKNIKY